MDMIRTRLRPGADGSETPSHDLAAADDHIQRQRPVQPIEGFHRAVAESVEDVSSISSAGMSGPASEGSYQPYGGGGLYDNSYNPAPRAAAAHLLPVQRPVRKPGYMYGSHHAGVGMDAPQRQPNPQQRPPQHLQKPMQAQTPAYSHSTRHSAGATSQDFLDRERRRQAEGRAEALRALGLGGGRP